MRKFCLILCLICFPLFLFSGCKKENPLLKAVSELRQDIYMGENENYSLKAYYGYKENPYVKDGKVGERQYALEVKLLNKSLEPASYFISLNHGGTEYKKELTLDAFSNALCAQFYITDFSLKEFSVNIICGENLETVTLKSLVPDGAIDYKKAIDYLSLNQPELIANYTDGDNFLAEIYLRVLVKDDAPYYFIGIATEKNLKAFLMDGYNGEVLAIRNVF